MTDEVKGAWQDMDTAPFERDVILHVPGYGSFTAQLRIGAGMNMDETPADQWQAVNEGDHPECWCDGACWGSNSGGIQSAGPTKWREIGGAA